MKFNDKLAQLRKEKGLSQEELGSRLNVTRQTVSKWELGLSKPDTDKLLEICKILDVDIKEIIDDNTEVSKNENKVTSTPSDLKPRKWLLIVLIIVEIIIAVIFLNKIVTHFQNKKSNGDSWGIFNVFKKDNLFKDISKESFNNSLEMYNGTQPLMFVSNLLDEIVTINKKNSDHQVTVVYNDIKTTKESEIKKIKRSFKEDDQVEVSFDYNNGYITKATLELITDDSSNNSTENDANNLLEDTMTNAINTTSSLTTAEFNGVLEMYSGTSFGQSVSVLLDNVINSNKKNPDHQINVVYNSFNTTDENEIRNMKSKFGTFDRYEVILDYDEAGYINQITIR